MRKSREIFAHREALASAAEARAREARKACARAGTASVLGEAGRPSLPMSLPKLAPREAQSSLLLSLLESSEEVSAELNSLVRDSRGHLAIPRGDTQDAAAATSAALPADVACCAELF